MGKTAKIIGIIIAIPVLIIAGLYGYIQFHQWTLRSNADYVAEQLIQDTYDRICIVHSYSVRGGDNAYVVVGENEKIDLNRPWNKMGDDGASIAIFIKDGTVQDVKDLFTADAKQYNGGDTCMDTGNEF